MIELIDKAAILAAYEEARKGCCVSFRKLIDEAPVIMTMSSLENYDTQSVVQRD